MKIKDIRSKSVKDLNLQLLSLYKDLFSLKLEKTSGSEFKKNHLFRFLRKDIARILTVIREFNKK